MDAPSRPVESLDVLPKRVVIHSGFVFSGHLDVPRLREAAANVVGVYPELNVTIKGDWFTVSFTCLHNGSTVNVDALSKSLANGAHPRRKDLRGTSSIATCLTRPWQMLSAQRRQQQTWIWMAHPKSRLSE
jgi:hypothetical protein